MCSKRRNSHERVHFQKNFFLAPSQLLIKSSSQFTTSRPAKAQAATRRNRAQKTQLVILSRAAFICRLQYSNLIELLQLKAVGIKQKIHDTHDDNAFFVSPKLDVVLDYDDFLEGIVDVDQGFLFFLHFLLIWNCER